MSSHMVMDIGVSSLPESMPDCVVAMYSSTNGCAG